MIYLTKGQKLFENPGLVVFGDTGYYNDGDVVICANVYAPDEPACGYEAKYIAYGVMVYGITDPDKLLEEVKKIDPVNMFGKNKEDVVVDKMVENIQTVEQLDMANDTASVLQNTDTAPSTSPIIENPADLSTTTPQNIAQPINFDVSSSTPEQIINPINVETSTTSPSILEETVNASTTDNAIVAFVKKKVIKKNKV